MTTNAIEFGELRSLLSTREDSDVWRGKLWRLIEAAEKQDQARYREEWLPYLSRELGDTPIELGTLTSLRQLEDAHRIAPFGRFTLEFVRRPGKVCNLKYLSNASSFGAVSTLRVHDSQAKREDIEHLVESPFIGTLETLELMHNDIGAGGVRAIAQSERLSGLKTLFLDHCHEHSESYAILADSHTLSGVTSLWLGGFRSGCSRPCSPRR